MLQHPAQLCPDGIFGFGGELEFVLFLLWVLLRVLSGLLRGRGLHRTADTEGQADGSWQGRSEGWCYRRLSRTLPRSGAGLLDLSFKLLQRIIEDRDAVSAQLIEKFDPLHPSKLSCSP